MARLDTLLLHNCALDSLPTSLGRLSSLTLLNVSINRLTVLPPTLGELESLTELNLSGNPKLITLPDSMAPGCKQLGTLLLGECPALRLPDNLHLAERLESITLTTRQIAVATAEVRDMLQSGRVQVNLL